MGVDGDDACLTPARARLARSWSGKSAERVGAEQHERVELARRPRRSGCRSRRCPRFGRHRSHRSRNQSRPVVEARRGRAAGREPGPCRGHRGRWPRRSTVRTCALGKAGEQPGDGVDDRRLALGERRPAEDDGDVIGAGEQFSRRGEIALDRPAAVETGERPRHEPGLARAVPQRRRGEGGHRVRCGLSSMTRDAVVDDGVAEPQEQDRQLLLQVGAEHHDGAALGSRPRRWWRGAGRTRRRPAGRRRAGSRRCRCRGRPSRASPRRRRPRW